MVVNNIEVVYSGAILVLSGVSFKVPERGIVAMLGANGAGKTTALKAISGLLKAEAGAITSGSIEFNEERIDNRSPEDRVKMGISQVMEGRRVFQHLTVDENLTAGAHVRKDRSNVKRDRDLVYDYFPNLKNLRSKTAGYLSGGEQQMLVIGRALIAQPKLLLLDEPSMGLSPILVEEIFEITKRITEEQKASVLLVEQNALAALSIADYGYVMENGRIALDGPAEKLIESPDVKEFYLGLSELGERKSYRDIKHYKRRKRWLV